MRKAAFVASTALALILSTIPVAWAQDTGADEAVQRAENRAQVAEAVTSETDAQLADSRAGLIDEAIEAIAETRRAIDAIGSGDVDAAIDALAIATGKLETVIAREPEMAFAPVAVDYVTYDVLGSVQSIRDIGNRVEDLVEDGRFQDARAILSNFASEIVIQTTSLPLATYPDAILEATALLDDGRTDEALTVLNTALGTLVVTETAIPLPPLRAEAMIAAAKDLLADDTTETDEAGLTARDYVEAARQELQVAEALGYGRKKDFEDLHDALDELDRLIEAREDTGGIFETIADRFKDLRERVFD